MNLKLNTMFKTIDLKPQWISRWTDKRPTNWFFSRIFISNKMCIFLKI